MSSYIALVGTGTKTQWTKLPSKCRGCLSDLQNSLMAQPMRSCPWKAAPNMFIVFSVDSRFAIVPFITTRILKVLEIERLSFRNKKIFLCLQISWSIQLGPLFTRIFSVFPWTSIGNESFITNLIFNECKSNDHCIKRINFLKPVTIIPQKCFVYFAFVVYGVIMRSEPMAMKLQCF